MALRPDRFGILRGAFACAVVALVYGSTGFAQVTLPAAVETEQLAKDAFATGDLPPGALALSADRWVGSDPDVLIFLLRHARTDGASPALADALRRLLLSPADPVHGAPTALGGEKLLSLVRAGATREARAIASLSSASKGDPATAEALAGADLLDDNLTAACARAAGLTAGRDNPFWVKLRVICYAQNGERDAADLTYGLLSDRGILTPSEEALYLAVAVGAPLKTLQYADDAVALAAIRLLDAPLSPGGLANAEPAVAAAIADVEDFPSDVRIAAANRAVATGAMDGARLRAIYASFPIPMSEIAGARDVLAGRLDHPLADALIYQAIAQMNAPEFLRDKSLLISQALGRATSFENAMALSAVFANDIEGLEGALISPGEAGSFALANMALGDVARARRWLATMQGGHTAATMGEGSVMAFIEHLTLFSELAPAAAADIARAAGVSLTPNARIFTAAGMAPADEVISGRIISAAFDAAAGGKPGQAALAAFAADANVTSAAREIIIAQSLEVAGLEQTARRRAFEIAWRATFPAIQEAPEISEGDADEEIYVTARPKGGRDADGHIYPRVKPARS